VRPGRPLPGLVKGAAELATPFQSIGLLVDSATIFESSYMHIKLVIQDDLEREFRRKLRFEFDGRTMSAEEFVHFSSLLASGVEPGAESWLKDFNSCLKLGAAGLGGSFLFIEKDEAFNKVAYFSLTRPGNEELQCICYVENLQT
jgi:hypothetical protein